MNLTRRDFLKQVGAASVALSMGDAMTSSAAASARPNIVFVFSDQQRWDTLGCYGQRLSVTPNLDKMAKQGVRFEHSFTCQPVCGPARAALQTGKYPTEVGCHVNGLQLATGEKTMAHHLSAAGYEVGYIGKWHLASMSPGGWKQTAVPPERRGGYKDYWLGSNTLESTSHSYDGHMFDADMKQVDFPKDRYRANCVTDYAIDYLKSRKLDKPFFLFLSYIEPHHQNDHKHFEGPRGSKEKFRDFEVPGDLVGTKGDWQEEYPDYLGCCNAIDANVGRIRETLDKLGIADNTLIVYTTDHANHFLTRVPQTYKSTCHDNSIRTPLIIYGPGFTGGKVVTELVSLIDLTPTVLGAAGADPPKYMRGRALQGLADGTAKDWPEEVFTQISHTQIGRAIRTKKWKYSVSVASNKKPQPPSAEEYFEDFLYDLENDPHERKNLVRDPACTEVRAKLAIALKRRIVAAGEKEPKISPALPEKA